jgi:hypothetical protein
MTKELEPDATVGLSRLGRRTTAQAELGYEFLGGGTVVDCDRQDKSTLAHHLRSLKYFDARASWVRLKTIENRAARALVTTNG